MKRYLLIGLLLICFFFVHAQDNTFPATGNVGIGTLSPGNKLSVVGGITATGTMYGKGMFFNVLQVGPLVNSPAYFYIDTKVPAIDAAAPQLHITGYSYSASNKAVKLTIGWYHYAGNFHWTQYQSDLGYYKPSRIRLGKYTLNGSQYIRIEIANDGIYYSNYSISATDPFMSNNPYDGWTWHEGEMPSESTVQITEVPHARNITMHGDMTIISPSSGYTAHLKAANPVIKLESTSTSLIYAALRGNQDTWLFGYNGPELYEDISIGTMDGSGYRTITLAAGGSQRMKILANGNIGIGTSVPTEKLSVNGNIRAKKIIVSQSGWPDYVFDSSYQLMPLNDLARYIAVNKHLPDIPSEKQVAEEGVSIGDQQALLLKKIEELTLYLINQEKVNKELLIRIANLESLTNKKSKRK